MAYAEDHGASAISPLKAAARAGAGLRARFTQGDLAVGTAALMQDVGLPEDVLSPHLKALDAACMTPVFVAFRGQFQCVFGVADQLRDEARDVVRALKARGVSVAMISGDRRAVAEGMAQRLGIDLCYAEQKPTDKSAVIEALAQKFGPVAFVGDGINDAPALAASDVGVAVGSGVDVALEAADVVLSGKGLALLPDVFRVSRLTLRNIRQNLFWAFIYNAALIPVAAGALYPLFGLQLSPMLGAGAMAASSVFVVLNALRLRRI